MVKIKRTKFLLGIDKLTSCRLRFVADQILSRMTSGRFSSFLELILRNLFYQKMCISFSGTWLSCSWMPRAVRRCCVRTAPSTCCDPTLCLTLHQSPLSLTWDVRHLYHHHCYQIPVSGDTPMFICILGLDCKEDVPKNSSLTIASL